MKFNKRLFGYQKKQVDRFLTDTQSRYEQILADQQQRITSLREENTKLKKELEDFREVKDRISTALIGANMRAEKIIKDSIHDAQVMKRDMERDVEENRLLSRKLTLEIETAIQQALEITRVYTDDLNKIRQRMHK
ncbi:MAG: DivIVA domain-containing protein [Eubacteriales bacterium]|nr:DivIVA domain-containing protein [Eubacteriales bacterium]